MNIKVKNPEKNDDKKRLVSNFFSLSILQAFTYIIPLFTLPYLVRVLGAERFGLVMFAQAFIMYFNVLVDYGFNLSSTREISIHRDNKEKVTEIFSSVMIIKLFLIIVSLIILTGIIFSFERFSLEWELYYLTFTWVVGQALFPVWFFQGKEKMKYITIVNITSKMIFALLIFIVIQQESDYIYVPILNGLGSIVGGIISLYIIYKHFNQRIKLYKFSVLKHYFIDSSHFFLSRASVTIYTSSNAFILGLFTSNTMVGYYSIAAKLYQGLQSLYFPITQTIYPYFSKTKNIIFFKKLFLILIFVNLFIFLGFYNFSNELIYLLFKINNPEVVYVFTLFLFSSLLHVPAILLGYPLLAAFGYPKYANSSVIYSSVFHILGLLILIIFNNINIYTLSIMVLLTESMVFFLRFYYAQKTNLLFRKEATTK